MRMDDQRRTTDKEAHFTPLSDPMMLSRTGLRASRQVLQPFQASRSFTQFTARRAHQSAEDAGLKGVYDNAFNRERLAVKQHAAATSGKNAAVR